MDGGIFIASVTNVIRSSMDGGIFIGESLVERKWKKLECFSLIVS